MGEEWEVGEVGIGINTVKHKNAITLLAASLKTAGEGSSRGEI